MAMNSDDELTFTREGGQAVGQDFDLIMGFEYVDDNLPPEQIVVRVWDNIASIRLPKQTRLIYDGPPMVYHTQNRNFLAAETWNKVCRKFDTTRGNYRANLGCYEIIFLDTELDSDALLHWYDKETLAHPNSPDLYKNNSLSQKCINPFSLVARLLKQAGAAEFWGADSPTLWTWEAIDLVCYCESINIAIKKANSKQNKQNVRRDEYFRVRVKDPNSGKA